MNLEDLQELYRLVDLARLHSLKMGEPSVAIILDRVLDVVYEKAKGLIDADAERKERRAVRQELYSEWEKEEWEREQHEEEQRKEELRLLDEQARWEGEGGNY